MPFKIQVEGLQDLASKGETQPSSGRMSMSDKIKAKKEALKLQASPRPDLSNGKEAATNQVQNGVKEEKKAAEVIETKTTPIQEDRSGMSTFDRELLELEDKKKKMEEERLAAEKKRQEAREKMLKEREDRKRLE